MTKEFDINNSKEIDIADVQVSERPTLVPVPKLNGYVYFKELTPADCKRREGESNEDLGVRLLVESWVDKDGNPKLSSIEQAQSKSKLKAITYISIAMNKFNGLSADAVEIEEKN